MVIIVFVMNVQLTSIKNFPGLIIVYQQPSVLYHLEDLRLNWDQEMNFTWISKKNFSKIYNEQTHMLFSFGDLTKIAHLFLINDLHTPNAMKSNF